MQGSHLTGLREIAKVHRGDFRLTPNQNLVVANVDAAAKVSSTRWSCATASTATPGFRRCTGCARVCGATDLRPRDGRSRALPAAPDAAGRGAARGARPRGRAAHAAHHRLPERLRAAVRCRDRLVGKAPGRYNLYFGGDAHGQRLNTLHLENVDEATIVAALEAAFARYAAERAQGERFGDFAWRAGLVTAAGDRDRRSDLMRALAWNARRRAPTRRARRDQLRARA